MGPLLRLRWQLILSHLAAIVLTIVSMVVAVVLIAGSWITAQSSSQGGLAQDARIVARAVGGMVARDDASTELDIVLRSLVRGDLRLLNPPGAFAPDEALQHFDWSWLRPVAYIVVVGRDGQPMASSEPGGAAFAPPERPAWDTLARAALADERNPRQLVMIRSEGGTALPPMSRETREEPAALGAYPVLDDHGRPVAAVIVASRTLPRPSGIGDLWRSLTFLGAASLVILVGASTFALIPSSLVGYLLSRRLVSRLERLGRAADALAAGDLSQRVEEGMADEVGQLMRRFNRMAERLSAAVAELEAAKVRTEDALRAKRELVANVSHELRTPLALIRGHVESLLMQSDADELRKREYLPVIHRETEHLSRLIDDLFALSTAEARALPLKLESVSLAELVEEVASSMRPIAWRERQITIVTSAAPDLQPARADRQRVSQVLGNLLRNALRHTPEGGLIAVRTDQQGGRASVTVEDTGEGIPPDRLPHIFERFYRGDKARDRDSGGAGLGLAIVREFVEAMGGEVSVESTPGLGSRFSFRLPLATGSPGTSIENS